MCASMCTGNNVSNGAAMCVGVCVIMCVANMRASMCAMCMCRIITQQDTVCDYTPKFRIVYACTSTISTARINECALPHLTLYCKWPMLNPTTGKPFCLCTSKLQPMIPGYLEEEPRQSDLKALGQPLPITHDPRQKQLTPLKTSHTAGRWLDHPED